MMNLKITFCFFAKFLFYSHIIAQATFHTEQYKFINLKFTQNYADIAVFDLFQDSYGFIWAGTTYGLNRYDGYKFVPFRTNPEDSYSISSNDIAHNAFYEDKERNLWVATMNGGLNKFNRNTEKFEKYQKDAHNKNSISHDFVNAITGDGQDGLWIATNGGGLNHLDSSKTKFTNYPNQANYFKQNEASRNLVTLLKDRLGRLWLGSNQGVIILDKNVFKQFKHHATDKNSLSGNFITDIIQDKKGNIWIGTDHGLNLWVEEAQHFIQFFPEEQLQNGNYNYILEVFQDHAEQYWLGTIAGLLHFDLTTNQFTAFKNNPSDIYTILAGPVYTIIEDQDKNLWLGTRAGVSILNRASATFLDLNFITLQTHFEQISGEDGICAIAESVEDTYYLATQKGLFIYQGNSIPKLILPGNFCALFKSRDGVLYAGTVNKGFYRILPNGKIIYNANQIENQYSANKLKGSRINSFAEDTQGYIWIGTPGGLNRFDPIRNQFKQYHNDDKNPNALTNAHIKTLFTDSKGNLWIGTLDGLNMLSVKELLKDFDEILYFKPFSHQKNNRNSINSNLILTIYEDSAKKLWIGTDAGLNSLVFKDTASWQRFYTQDGLPQHRVTNIMEDDQHDIWITTFDAGLSCFVENENRFINFFPEDGLNSGSFNPNTLLKTKNGLFLLSGINGINAFDPAKIQKRAVHNHFFYFVDFQIFNKSVPIGGKDSLLQKPIYLTSAIHLKYHHKVFSFEFSTLNYIHPDKETYRYRLQNFDDDWRYIGNERKITFTNLYPGTYALEIEISKNRKNWIPAGKTMKIIIHPPWYLTWQFFTLLALAIAAILYYFYRFQLKRRLVQAEALRLKELDEVKTRLYTNITHEFRTPLTIILGMADQIERSPRQWLQEGLQMIKRNGQNLLRLVNQMLDLARLDAGKLPVNMVQSDIITYVKTLLEFFRSYADSKNISMEFTSEPAQVIMDFDPDKIKDIISNLLSNALKFTPEDGKVIMQIGKAPNDYLFIRVEDTGEGIPAQKLPHIFERFYIGDDSETRRSAGTGIGLAITQELVKLLGGEITAESEPGQGAIFKIKLPISNNAPLKDNLPEKVSIEQEALLPLLGNNGAKTLPLALIVEDNADVVTYLITCLQNQYRIEVAYNGRAGINKAIEMVPDVIISDVMMPEKDGFELCRTLKHDIRTSHVPIILLTARADMDSRLEGLEGGADAYLTKPFNQQELEISLRKSLELRQRLRDRYAHDIPVETNKIFSRDDLFVKELQALVEVEYASLTIPDMAIKMNMSRAQLGRKVNALLNTSPHQYLHHYRMQRAYHLVKNSDMPIQDIAYQTGFSDPAHFSNAFLKEFQQRPSDLR